MISQLTKKFRTNFAVLFHGELATEISLGQHVFNAFVNKHVLLLHDKQTSHTHTETVTCYCCIRNSL